MERIQPGPEVHCTVTLRLRRLNLLLFFVQQYPIHVGSRLLSYAAAWGVIAVCLSSNYLTQRFPGHNSREGCSPGEVQ